MMTKIKCRNVFKKEEVLKISLENLNFLLKLKLIKYFNVII
jgi:hypothetical protein